MYYDDYDMLENSAKHAAMRDWEHIDREDLPPVPPLSPYFVAMQERGVRCGRCRFGMMELEPTYSPDSAFGRCPRCGHVETFTCAPGMGKVTPSRGRPGGGGKVIKFRPRGV